MPLRKLWNSLRRQSKPIADQSSRDASVEHGVVKLDSAIARQPESNDKQQLYCDRSKSDLSNLLEELSFSTVLEIGVGDGQRAVEFLSHIVTGNRSIRYFAIDQFELGGGELTLREFHQMLRSVGVRPQIFPETIPDGLTRFLHTIGTADLILIADQISESGAQQVQHLLMRVSNEKTTILERQQNQWVRKPFKQDATRKAA